MSASIFLLLSVSCFVRNEPAPYDLLAVVLMSFSFLFGLRVPSGLQVPLALLALIVLANLISIGVAHESTRYSFGNMALYIGVTTYLFGTWLWFASLAHADPQGLLRVVWPAYTFAGLITVLLQIYAYFRLGPGADNFMENARAMAYFKDPNVTGAFLIPLAVYHVGALLQPGGWRQLWRYAVAGAIASGLLLAFSRGAWAATVLALVIYFVLRTVTAGSIVERARLASTGMVALVVVVVALAGLATLPAVSDMIETRAKIQTYDIEEGGRFSTQGRAIVEIFENPLGLGPNNSDAHVGRAPHNVYIKLFSDNGWLGGFAWLMFALVNLWRGLVFVLGYRGSMQFHALVCYASVAAIFGESIIVDTLHWRHLFLLSGVLWGIMSFAERERAPDPAPPA